MSVYSMLNVAANLDGRSIIGFAEGDNVVQVSQVSDVGKMMIGADGTPLFSQSANRSATITLRLKHTSPTHRQLTEKWKAQRAGRVMPFPFDVTDTSSGEGGTAGECYILRAPDDQKGESATNREWVIVAGEYSPATPNN